MGVPIQTNDGTPASIEIFEGTSKKSGKPYTAISIKVGKWSTLVFAKSSFELDYLREVLG